MAARRWRGQPPPSKMPARSRLNYRRFRALRLRASGRPRRAPAPPRRGAARGALRFSGPVLGRRPSALSALDRKSLRNRKNQLMLPFQEDAVR